MDGRILNRKCICGRKTDGTLPKHLCTVCFDASNEVLLREQMENGLKGRSGAQPRWARTMRKGLDECPMP